MADRKEIAGRGLIRRPAEVGLRFVDAPQADWRAVLTLGTEDLSRLMFSVSEVAARLPRGTGAPAARAVQRRLLYRGQAGVLREYSSALRLFPEVLVPDGPEGLAEIASRIARYESLRARAGHAVNAALDLRSVLGALQSYALQQVLRVVVARMESPDCPRAERERLESRFSRLLLRRQTLLMSREERLAERTRRQKEAAAELAAIEERTTLEDAMTALRQGRTLDPATLERAAAIYRKQQQKQPAPKGPDEGRATRR